METLEWTDDKDGSSGHVNSQLVVQNRRLGVGDWLAAEDQTT